MTLIEGPRALEPRGATMENEHLRCGETPDAWMQMLGIERSLTEMINHLRSTLLESDAPISPFLCKTPAQLTALGAN